MPPGGLGSGKPDQTAIARSFAEDVLSVKNGSNEITNKEEEKTTHSEPLVDAAQNLAFLKHTPEKGESRKEKPAKTEPRDVQSIPSLVSSDTTASPDEEGAKTRSAPQKQESGGGVNSLLMAAYAMTELNHEERKKEDTETPTTPEKVKAEPKFRSPKRKSLERRLPLAQRQSSHGEKQTDSSSDSSLATPGEQRKVKRTRVGTVERKGRASQDAPESSKGESDTGFRRKESESDEESGEEGSSTSAVKSEAHDLFYTPKQSKPPIDNLGVLTPVTARCIDFQQMGMSEQSQKAEAVDEKEMEAIASV
mmetsp:Transcript_31048/g.71554  ORF Transcript_31048/g.71554 Transcript_31048/m.71554 type:complete len:308 (-) Transcript_31048:559-1482(-)